MSLNKKALLDREVTRRQFMKLTGKGLAGVALSGSLLSLFGCTQAQADAGLVDVIPTPHFVLVANRAKCTGCQRCEANCTLANDGDVHPYMSRIHVRQNFNFGEAGGDPENFANGGGIFGDWTFGPETCSQCDACMSACPMKAISADPATGTRVIDQEKCVGCGLCTQACPKHLPRLDENRKSTKCIACGACVAGCPTSALRMVSWEEIQAAL